METKLGAIAGCFPYSPRHFYSAVKNTSLTKPNKHSQKAMASKGPFFHRLSRSTQKERESVSVEGEQTKLQTSHETEPYHVWKGFGHPQNCHTHKSFESAWKHAWSSEPNSLLLWVSWMPCLGQAADPKAWLLIAETTAKWCCQWQCRYDHSGVDRATQNPEICSRVLFYQKSLLFHWLTSYNFVLSLIHRRKESFDYSKEPTKGIN